VIEDVEIYVDEEPEVAWQVEEEIDLTRFADKINHQKLLVNSLKC